MSQRKATKLGPPDAYGTRSSSVWIPGTEPDRTEHLSASEIVELVIGVIGIAMLVACIYILFACSTPDSRNRWVPSHWEGDVWVQGHHEGDPLPVD